MTPLSDASRAEKAHGWARFASGSATIQLLHHPGHDPRARPGATWRSVPARRCADVHRRW